MKKKMLFPLLGLMLVATNALADGDMGKLEYRNSCAACHGAEGKGGTEMDDFLRIQPPDLTQLMARNGGVFPTARVYEVIDGRLAVKAHGPRTMPVWGQRYTEDATRLFGDPYLGEASVRVRIISLIDYLYSIQGR